MDGVIRPDAGPPRPRSASPRGRRGRGSPAAPPRRRLGRPLGARAEDDDGDERRRQNEMRGPGMAEGGVGEHAADRSGIEGGAPVVGHRGRFEREPPNRGEESDDAGDERQAPDGRRQGLGQSFRRVEPKIGAGAERQHRSQKMGEAAKGKSGHARAPPRGPSHLHPAHGSALHAARGRGPDAEHLELDFDRAGALETSVALTVSPFVRG